MSAFKAFGDPVRLRLLSTIASRSGGEICVCDLTPAFELSLPTISRHLKQLKHAGLIDSERRGTWVYYRLVPEATDRLAAALTRRADPVDAGTAAPGAASRARHLPLRRARSPPGCRSSTATSPTGS